MRQWISDLRFALRSLSRAPAFTAGAVVVLGLGMGVALIALRFLDAAVWRPIAGVERPAELQAIRLGVSFLAWSDLRDATRNQIDLAAFSHRSFVGEVGDRSRRLEGAVVTGNAFSVLGVKMAAGRRLAEADDASGVAAVVVSHRLAIDLAGSAERAVGRSLRLNGVPFEIVGVASPEFRRLRVGPSREVWLTTHGWTTAMPTSFPASLTLQRRSWGWLTPIGRPRPGVALDTVQAALRAAGDAQSQAFPNDTRERFGSRLNLQSAASAALGDAPAGVVPAISAALLAAVVSLLLLACANVAHLFSARVASRRHEFATRFALGGGQLRVASILIAEALVLSVAAGGVALLLLTLGANGLAAVPLQGELTIGSFGLEPDLLSVAGCVALTLLAALAFGVAPALRAGSRAGLGLRGTSAGIVDHREGASASARGVAIQVALGFVLLAVSTLLARAAADGLKADVGYRPDGLMLAAYDLGLARIDPVRAERLHEAVLAEVAAIPGVQGVTLSQVAPLSGSVSTESLTVSGYVPGPEEESVEAEVVPVGAGYFETLGVPVTRGRGFNSEDRAGAPMVAVVNRAFAERYFGDEVARRPETALGRTLSIVSASLTVVGVVENVRAHDLLETPPPLLYLPLAQRPVAEQVAETYVFAATGTGAADRVPLQAFEAAVRRALPGTPVYEVGRFADRFESKVSPQLFVGGALRVFGILGLILLASGVYAVVAHRVALRRREIGLRAALGAAPRTLERQFIGEGLRAVVWGLAFGIPLAVALGFAVRGLLYRMHPADPWSLASGVVSVGVVAWVAALLPARRAASVEPAIVLRGD